MKIDYYYYAEPGNYKRKNFIHIIIINYISDDFGPARVPAGYRNHSPSPVAGHRPHTPTSPTTSTTILSNPFQINNPRAQSPPPPTPRHNNDAYEMQPTRPRPQALLNTMDGFLSEVYNNSNRWNNIKMVYYELILLSRSLLLDIV